MRISSVELARSEEADGQVQLLVVRSDSGGTGVGEIARSRDGQLCQRSHAELADLLVGRDPFDVEALLAATKSVADGTIADVALISAATSAMADLAGQSLGVPLHQLLGGRVRDHVRACAVGWATEADGYAELAAAARRTVESGFSALRVEPFANPASHRLGDVDAATEFVRVVRDAVPSDVDLVVTADGVLGVGAAIEFADALRPLEPMWLEAPARVEPVGPLRWISERTVLPLAAGRGARADVLRDLASVSVVDHLIIEVGQVGGMVEARRIAALAEVHHIGIVVLGSGGSVSLGAALQFAAVVPNLSMVEVRPGLVTVDGGMVAVDVRPGLGFAPALATTGAVRA